jgi:hypothetical protein
MGMNPKMKAWNQHVMETYRAMKKRSPSTRLGDAMKAAKKTWKKGGAAPAVTRKNRKASRKNRSTRKN